MTQNKTTKGLAALALTAIITSFGHAASFTSHQATQTLSAGATFIRRRDNQLLMAAIADRVTHATERHLSPGQRM